MKKKNKNKQENMAAVDSSVKVKRAHSPIVIPAHWAPGSVCQSWISQHQSTPLHSHLVQKKKTTTKVHHTVYSGTPLTQPPQNFASPTFVNLQRSWDLSSCTVHLLHDRQASTVFGFREKNRTPKKNKWTAIGYHELQEKARTNLYNLTVCLVTFSWFGKEMCSCR